MSEGKQDLDMAGGMVKNSATVGLRQKKALGGPRASFFDTVLCLFGFLLFEELLVLVVELINATGAVDELHLTSIEGV